MTRSLERRLTRILGLVIVVVGLAAGGVSFILAYQEAKEFQDDTLRQIAALTDVDQLPLEGRNSSKLDASAIAGSDPENSVVVVRLTASPLSASAAWLSPDLPPGFYTRSSEQGDWRVFIRQMRNGERIAVAQMTVVRSEAAGDSALHTLITLGILLLLLVWLSAKIVRNELAPVRLLAQKIDEQPPERPATLPDAGIPEEIAPFVRSINGLLRRIMVLMGEQRRFIAEAAHELRSPLTALSLQAQNLEKVGTLEAVRERILPLRSGIERARRLTEQLLNLARSQSSLPVLQTIDVLKMARELIAEYLPVAEKRGIDLGLEGGENIGIYTDPYALRLVLKNGLDNALCYTPGGGQVTVRAYIEKNDAVIEILDSGPGIPATERERVFDPFYRVAGSSGEGSGLGLAIVRDAASRLGGSVSLHDQLDEPGLVFRYRQSCIT